MDDEKLSVSVSVRNLVEFILRSGDIDNRKAHTDTDAMQEGARIHRKIQKSMPEGYRAEVALKTVRILERNDREGTLALTVEGRADGIYKLNQDIIIDEIKSTYLSLEHITEPVPVHEAQAKCYACIYGKDEGLTRIGVQLTYCNIDSEEIKRFNKIYEVADLCEWFDNVVKEYSKWLFWEADWKKTRDETIRKLEFPFTYRPGQRELVGDVYKTVSRGKKLFIEAPTGVGKTISTVFPAVWNVGEGKASKIFYLTAKTIARTVAEDTFGILREKGLKFRYVTLTAKEKICILEKPDCNPVSCSRAAGHMDRINDCVFDLLTHEEEINRELILRYSEKHNVCPFEMSLDVSLWADAVICDYNYAFDPDASLKRFFAEEKKNDFIFLIDEAHNLLERAREMYSSELTKEAFLNVKRSVATIGKKLEKQLEYCNKAMLALKRECDDFQVWDNADDLYNRLLRAISVFEDFLDNNPGGFEGKDQALDLFFDMRRFIEVYENMDEAYRIYTDYNERGDFRIKLLCMEPASKLRKIMDNTRASVLFSATLLPMNYYKEQLGGEAEDYAIYAPSPFSPEKRIVMVGRDVSTRYTRRNRDEYLKVAAYIEAFVKAKKGNYMVFFSSYKMMEDVLKASDVLQSWCYENKEEDEDTPEILKKLQKENYELVEISSEKDKTGFDKISGQSEKDIKILVQRREMKEKEKEAFLEEFKENPDSTLVGFTVMGGAFSEGIDLTGDRLTGAVIVGCGLPMVGNEKELFKFYFDEKSGNGFEYSYLYPGMNKVMQSAGRVIRTVDDVGAILLLDERFGNPQYTNLFPREWFPYVTVNIGNVKERLSEFYEKH
jgi:Rad3-related DNA helicase